MKYSVDIEINAPVQKVADILTSHEKMKAAVAEIKSYEQISGKPKEVGAKSKITIDGLEIIETILEIDLPKLITLQYDTPKGGLVISNRLSSVTAEKTKLSISHDVKLKGAASFAGPLLKPAFSKYSLKKMLELKAFIESVKG
ncbi:MAG: hypothetical protein JWO06_1358 [Bacteroidota bacterium]|nr:hypothetical protein [Bacteroidota bacterium]